ncbi:putative aldo-keto reductase 1 [Senna tora]|uniref:Putative aldo-keto reductase 1 n=1 Tax=Senna tora TaxID=362788 RepID=A0A834T8W1_9FABA|nr:putative aldo-keto reductase 1 [Senna tora]
MAPLLSPAPPSPPAFHTLESELRILSGAPLGLDVVFSLWADLQWDVEQWGGGPVQPRLGRLWATPFCSGEGRRVRKRRGIEGWRLMGPVWREEWSGLDILQGAGSGSRGEAGVAGVGVGSGALGGVAEGCVVCGGQVVLVAVHPQELAVEVHKEWDLDERGSLVEVGPMKTRGGILLEWQNHEVGFGIRSWSIGEKRGNFKARDIYGSEKKTKRIVWHLYNDPLPVEVGISITKHAFSKGITFFDSADAYAEEILVGKRGWYWNSALLEAD